MKKGKFLHPVIYNFAKSNKKEFLLEKNKNLNVRSSFFLKKFSDCIFHIHNGKFFVVNDPVSMQLLFKSYSFYNFKLGQFSYNRHVSLKGRKIINISRITDDLKKKKGFSIKIKKKKRLIFTKI